MNSLSPSTATLLLIGDDGALLATLSRCLHHSAIRLLSTITAAEGLRFLTTHRPDAVLLSL